MINVNFLSKKIVYKNFFNVIQKKSELFFVLKKMCYLLNIVCFLHKSIFFQLKLLKDLTAVDYLWFKQRFKLCYFFCSLIFVHTCLLSIRVGILEKGVSLINFCKSAIWAEREVFDMFGLSFKNNWDLRKILTDYIFFGFPLRKDFPLTGYVELFFNEKIKSTFEALVELMQELRFFALEGSFLELWNKFSDI